MRTQRSLELPMIGLTLIATSHPIFTFSSAIFFYLVLFRSYLYIPCRRIPVRIDYLPHLDAISVMKIGIFGSMYNNIYKVSDLEKTEFDTYDENVFWNMHKDYIDSSLGYKIKNTKEIIMFEKDGLWNWEGINHPLLNIK